ncbi:alpha-amylase [Streptomyces sp. NPDC003470]|uniref:alpha-amylase n=1 Tax=Streptomyces sp. NPDC059701 TaxID=3346914 RepID=UPI0036A11112
MRSTFMVCAVALAMAAPATVAHAGSQEHAGNEASVPACLTYSPGWRYTFVNNDCPTPHRVKVLYGDGTDVPCQEVAPRDWFTFPGYGTEGNTVEGIVLCDQADGA